MHMFGRHNSYESFQLLVESRNTTLIIRQTKVIKEASVLTLFQNTQEFSNLYRMFSIDFSEALATSNIAN